MKRHPLGYSHHYHPAWDAITLLILGGAWVAAARRWPAPVIAGTAAWLIGVQIGQKAICRYPRDRLDSVCERFQG